MGTPSSIDQIPPQYNRQHVPQTLRDEKANTPEAGKLILPSPKTNYEIVNMCIPKRKKKKWLMEKVKSTAEREIKNEKFAYESKYCCVYP